MAETRPPSSRPRGGRGSPRGRDRNQDRDQGDDLLDKLVHHNRVPKVVQGGPKVAPGDPKVIQVHPKVAPGRCFPNVLRWPQGGPR